MERKNYKISREVYKYPYCAKSIESEEFLSEKICCYTIKIRKKMVRKTKRVFLYGQLICALGNGLSPIQAIGLPILPTNMTIIRSIHSNTDLSKKVIIAQVIKEMSAEIYFTQKEMDELYNLSIGYKTNSLSQEELITKISNLRGGDFVDITAALAFTALVILVTNNIDAFQINQNVIAPPHLQWLYGNNYKPGQFGYGKSAGPRSITVTGLTQNAGSEKKDPSSGSWDYNEIMRKLERQNDKETINLQVCNNIYTLDNSNHYSHYELSNQLADQMYNSIRESDTDICDIAQNLGFKATNIKM